MCNASDWHMFWAADICEQREQEKIAHFLIIAQQKAEKR